MASWKTVRVSFPYNPGADALASAGGPGHEVALDEARHDLQVGLHVAPVDQDVGSIARLAEVDEVVRVVVLVVDHFDAVHPRRPKAQHLFDLAGGHVAVRAGPDDDGDLVVLEPSVAERPDDVNHQAAFAAVRHRAGVVGDDDNSLDVRVSRSLRPRDLHQGRRGDGRCECFCNSLARVHRVRRGAHPFHGRLLRYAHRDRALAVF